MILILNVCIMLCISVAFSRVSCNFWRIIPGLRAITGPLFVDLAAMPQPSGAFLVIPCDSFRTQLL